MLRKLTLVSALCMVSAPAWAGLITDGVAGPPLPAPGIVGLVAAGVIGAIFVARRKK